MEKVNTLKLFIFPFVLQLKHCRNIHFNVQNCRKYFVLFSLYKGICLFLSLFGNCGVDFWLKTNPAEVNLFYFSIFSIFRMFSALKNFYLIFHSNSFL